MLKPYGKHWYLLFWIFLTISSGKTFNYGEWSNYLSEFIREEKYNALILLNAEKNDFEYELNTIIQAVSKLRPVQEIDFDQPNNTTIEIEVDRDSTENLRISTSILIIHSLEHDQDLLELLDIFNWLKGQLGSKKHPRILVILLKGNKISNHRIFLHKLWLKRFLDVTILEIVNEYSRPKLKFIKRSRQIIIIHIYNPFLDFYTKRNFDSGDVLFPNKLRDLNGYKLKVGVFLEPPSISYIKKDNNSITDVYGIDAELSKAFSQVMNSSILWVSSNESLFGTAHCVKKKNSGFFYDVIHNRINYVANAIMRFSSCLEYYAEWSSCSRFNRIVILVPIASTNRQRKLTLQWNIWNLFFLSGVLVIPWISSRILRFDPVKWRLLYLYQSVLGFPSPHPAQKQAERILSAATIIICMLYSSYIFTALTDISLSQTSVHRINTLDDVLLSNLTLIIPQNMLESIVNITTGKTHRILMKSLPLNITFRECIYYLRIHRNTSCIVTKDVFDVIKNSAVDESGLPTIQMINEDVYSSPSCLIMEAASPFMDRFNSLKKRVQQSGLLEKWFQTPTIKMEKNLNYSSLVEEKFRSAMLLQLNFILLFGYFWALLSFLFEVLISRSNRSMDLKNKFQFNRKSRHATL